MLLGKGLSASNKASSRNAAPSLALRPSMDPPASQAQDMSRPDSARSDRAGELGQRLNDPLRQLLEQPPPAASKSSLMVGLHGSRC